MEEKPPSMAHQYDDQIPSQPLELKKPHQLKDNMEQEQEDDTRRQTPSSSKSHLCNKVEIALQEMVLPPALGVTQRTAEPEGMTEDNGRERLKRHRVEVAGRVWIPDMWGQEELLKDWIDCTVFDPPLVTSRIMMARAALVEEGTRVRTGGLRIENRC